jgi:hypothetical protein
MMTVAVMEKRKDLLFREDHQPAAYYAAASVYYQLESMIRKGRIPSDLRPARFHILSAMKILVIGPGPLPRASKAARARCDMLVDTVWDPVNSERLVFNPLPLLQRSIDAERATGTSLSEMVRTKRFADRVRREVLHVTSQLRCHGGFALDRLRPGVPWPVLLVEWAGRRKEAISTAIPA